MKITDAKKLRVGNLVHVDKKDPIDITATYPARIAGISLMEFDRFPSISNKLIFLVIAEGEGTTEKFAYVDHWDLPNYDNNTGSFA